MSGFREIYSTERFAQVLAINTAFLAGQAEVEHVTLQSDAYGNTWSKNVKFGDPPVYRNWLQVGGWESPTPDADHFYVKDSYIVTQTAGGFVRIVGRIIGGDGSAGYQLAGRPYDDLAVYGYDTREAAYADAVKVLRERATQ